MSVTFYDTGLVTKIKSVFKNTIYQERSATFHTITDKNGGVQFPLISIFRPDGWSLSQSNTDVMGKNFVDGFRQVYVDLKYQIDIYSNTREDLEEITAELVLYLLKNPSYVVKYKTPDGSSVTDVKVSLGYVSGPERTSELEDSTKGRIYRYTLTYNVHNAELLVFLNPDPSSGEGQRVTQVIVEIIPETSIDLLDSSGKIVYEHKEEN